MVRVFVDVNALFKAAVDVEEVKGEGGGDLVITGVEIKVPEEALSEGLKARDLRKLRLGDAIDLARAQMERDWEKPPMALRTSPGIDAENVDEFYGFVANDYLRALQDSQRAPIIRLAERYGEKPDRVRAWVARARQRGWLGPGRSGVAGGRGTEKLRRFVAEKQLQ